MNMRTALVYFIWNMFRVNGHILPTRSTGALFTVASIRTQGPMPAPEELADMPKLHARSVMVGSDTPGRCGAD